jgi:hypothetical protein
MNIICLLDRWDISRSLLMQISSLPKMDFSLESAIERSDSQQFSLGIFVFMVIGVLVFSAITFLVIYGKKAPKTTRLGEKLMFAGLIMGVISAVIIGASQLLVGYTF